MAPRGNNDTEYFSAILDIRDTVTRTEQKLDDHLRHEQIHQVPPCELAKDMNKRQWAAVLFALGAFITAAGKYVWNELGK